MLSESNTEHKDVKELLLRIDEQKDETLHIMNQLEDIYQRSKEYENAKKVNDEADACGIFNKFSAYVFNIVGKETVEFKRSDGNKQQRVERGRDFETETR